MGTAPNEGRGSTKGISCKLLEKQALSLPLDVDKESYILKSVAVYVGSTWSEVAQNRSSNEESELRNGKREKKSW